MKTLRFLFLSCLFGGFVDSSITPQSIISKVGNQAILPCSWKSRLAGSAAPSTCHIQWATPQDTVFELRGEQRWQAEEFRGRAEVPEDRLGSGDCSLVISDVQIVDTGRYESFMVVDTGRSKKTRVFIQSVRLSVLDHKSQESRAPGEDLVLDFYTRHSMRVVFQGRNSSEWSDLWVRGNKNSERLFKHPQQEQLTVTSLTSSDDGTFKVLDEYGLAVSTVQLSIRDNWMSPKLPQAREHREPTDEAAHSSSSALLLLLLSALHVLHLL